MKPKNILIPFAILLTLVFTACSAAAPETTTETGAVTVAEEAAQEATEAPVEEAASEESASDEAATYIVDTAASSIAWRGEKPLKYDHVGTVNIAEGQLTFAGDQLTGSSFTIDMTSIVNEDLIGKDKEKADLEGHLKSDDFFGVETFPTATLVIKSAEPTGTDGQYTAVADLTMKDITNEITFVTDVTVGEGTLNATADIVVDRSQFDVRFGSGSFFDNLGDKLISDEMELTITLVANS